VSLFILTLSFAPAAALAQTINPASAETEPRPEDILSKKVIVISPTTFELTANPGEKISNKLKIYNPGTEPLFIEMEAQDFTTVGEEGQVVVKETESDLFSLAKWVIPWPKNFTLSPGEEKIVDFSIVVPLSAEPGGHYATIMAAAKSSIEGTTGLAVAQKTGALVLLTVAGQIQENLLIKKFEAPSFSEYGPIPFKIHFENAGTVHIKPQGFISVTNIFDEKIIDIPFPQHNIFPGKMRTLEAQWDEKWLFGKYTATLVGSYGLGNTPFTALTTFWVIPWKIAGGILLALLGILIFLWKIKRRMWAALKILTTGKI